MENAPQTEGTWGVSRNAEAAEAEFALRAPSDIVMRVLELSGTLELFAFEGGPGLDGVPAPVPDPAEEPRL